MKPRSNYVPGPGQVWRSSDPRRLSAFRIVRVDVATRWVRVEVVTGPFVGDRRSVPIEQFSLLGTKGYTRVS